MHVCVSAPPPRPSIHPVGVQQFYRDLCCREIILNRCAFVLLLCTLQDGSQTVGFGFFKTAKLNQTEGFAVFTPAARLPLQLLYSFLPGHMLCWW